MCKKMMDLDHMKIFIHAGKIFQENVPVPAGSNTQKRSPDKLENLKQKPAVVFTCDIDDPDNP